VTAGQKFYTHKMKQKHVEDNNGNEGHRGKKRSILYETFKKWQRHFDNEFNSLTWLDCVTMFQSGKKVVVLLHCSNMLSI